MKECFCVHEEVCKRDGVCPFYKEEIIKKPLRNNRKPHKFSSKKQYTTSNEDMVRVRQYLREMRSKGKLTDNQDRALSTLGGKKTARLTEVQREQLLSILDDVRANESSD